METLAGPTPSINLRDVRERVRDLIAPKAVVYWIDLILSVVAGWGAFFLALGVPAASPWHLGLCAVSALALYRGAMFIHELTHLPKGAVPGFHAAWDALLGIPLQLPSFLYLGVHLDHHRRTVYGTSRDPEYLPLARLPRRHLAWFLLQAPLIPALLWLRFAVLAPLSVVLGPPFRRLVVERASALVINPRYRREPPAASLRRRWLACEAAASAVAIGATVATATGVLAPRLFVQWFCVSAAVAVVNQLRTLGAHRWRNDGAEIDVWAQFQDSINTPHPLGALWAPVGLRYHALHHFIPDMPYHALGQAHARLAKEMPPESGYSGATSPGLVASIAEVWRARR